MVIEQAREARDDREAEPQTLGAVAFRILELIELLEDRVMVIFGYPGARVPNLNRDA